MLRSVLDALIERYYCYKYGKEYVATHLNPKKLRMFGAKIWSNYRIYTKYFSSEPYLIEIGNHVTITDGVSFVTHDGSAWAFREKEPDIELLGKITIGTNVFIGFNSTI